MADAPPQVTENGAAQVEEPGFKVFVGNLPYAVKDEGLRAFFAPVESDIISAQVITRGRQESARPAGYGFVAFKTEEAAKKAVELLDKKELEGRPVAVELAKPPSEKEKNRERKTKRRPGRRGSKAVPGEVTEAEANGEAKEATEDAGEPKKKKKPRKAKKPKTATAAGEQSTDTAGEGGENKKAPRPRKARAARPPRPAGEDPEGEPSKTVVFVANLGFNVDDAGLAQIFTEAGISVTTARIVRMSWGRPGRPKRSRGYGFVDTGSEEEQKKAIEVLDNKDFGGRVISVKVAINPKENEGEAAISPAPADDTAAIVAGAAAAA